MGNNVGCVTKEFQYGHHVVRLETGRIARQASGAVLVSMGKDTVVLVTAVGVESGADDASRDFFPLTVNYQERTYAAGKIPGGFFKREGRPSENETLVSRLIDRPLRPLFPKEFVSEVQVIATVMSIDPEINPDIAALLGASAALAISGMPFNGPLGAARVGYKDGQYLLNPTVTELATSELDLVVAGTEHAVLMVESEAKELSEEVMLGAVVFGHDQMLIAIQAIKEFAKEVGTESWNWQPKQKNADHIGEVRNKLFADLSAAYDIQEKLKRRARLDELRAEAKLHFVDNADQADANKIPDRSLANIISGFESEIVRGRILDGQPRIDGRDTKTIRNIAVEVGLIPRAHGSALFTRGETQAIVVATLGTERDAQIIDALEGERKDTFMLHYNFPPYSVGEVGFVGSPKRREIGHGRLARRAVQAVLPTMEQFPYVLRVVSEITESNGSSSMASVCGTSLALMDAGVPISGPVAGIAMGLIKEKDRFAVLSDILGDEDHLGDMDFKVAGTERGVTALQMDIKIEGITKEIMDIALNQAREGRLHILGKMTAGLTEPRAEISMFAPRIITIRIDPEKIRDVIGKGGVTIRALTEETGAIIDITDDGVVKIAATNTEAGLEAKRRIELITATAEVGKVYHGRVVKIVDFGAFVNFLPGKDGLVHISQISNERVENVGDILSEGQEIHVKVMEIDRQGRIRLSIKDAVEETIENA